MSVNPDSSMYSTSLWIHKRCSDYFRTHADPEMVHLYVLTFPARTASQHGQRNWDTELRADGARGDVSFRDARRRRARYLSAVGFSCLVFVWLLRFVLLSFCF